jgi:glycosyltransferase involved in cell wall biosynthesis
MRVAFDVSSTRGNKTGIGIYTEKLLDALHKYAPQIEVVALDDGATADQRTDRRIWREQEVLPRLIRAARPDLVHLTGFGVPLRQPRPVIVTIHDVIGILFARNFPRASRFYWSRYLPYTLRWAKHLIAPSERTKRDVVKFAQVPGERVSVIPSGRDPGFQPIEDGRVLEDARAQLQLPRDFFLFVSTLEPRKGVDTLIAAYAQIAAQVPEQLVLVGKRGWYWEKLFAQIERAGLGSRVRRLDYVPQQQLPVLYNLARAFVFPSRYEGFGFPPLEAMASGTPVICSNAASLPEVVGDAALLLAPEDADALAAAMLRVARDADLRAELRARGLAQAQMFSWERAARETAAVYDNLFPN